MSAAMAGEHLCKKHQGNHSHYDEQNCTICKLQTMCEELEKSAEHHKTCWSVTYGDRCVCGLNDTLAKWQAMKEKAK